MTFMHLNEPTVQIEWELVNFLVGKRRDSVNRKSANPTEMHEVLQGFGRDVTYDACRRALKRMEATGWIKVVDAVGTSKLYEVTEIGEKAYSEYQTYMLRLNTVFAQTY